MALVNVYTKRQKRRKKNLKKFTLTSDWLASGLEVQAI